MREGGDRDVRVGRGGGGYYEGGVESKPHWPEEQRGRGRQRCKSGEIGKTEEG